MWTTLAEAATNSPPKVPSELIGVIVTALITGATAIVVAIVQRKRSGSSESAAPATGGRVFVISETEWCAVRDRSLSTESALAILQRYFDGHVRTTDAAVDKVREDLANIKGQLGIR